VFSFYKGGRLQYSALYVTIRKNSRKKYLRWNEAKRVLCGK
jgi:hypothetical protein